MGGKNLICLLPLPGCRVRVRKTGPGQTLGIPLHLVSPRSCPPSLSAPFPLLVLAEGRSGGGGKMQRAVSSQAPTPEWGVRTPESLRVCVLPVPHRGLGPGPPQLRHLFNKLFKKDIYPFSLLI